jgi:predicted dehydrogenase
MSKPSILSRRSWLAAAPIAAQNLARAAQPTLRLPQKVRIALAGVQGHIGEITNHLKEAPDVEVVAVADPDPKATARFARGALAGVRQYTDYRQMLDKEKLDMLAVGGPNGSRAEILLAAIERKLHIVSEKPLAIDRAGLTKIRAGVERQHLRLTMLLPMRFLSTYRALKHAVDSGAIGQVAQIAGQKSYKLGEREEWMRHRASYGGTIPYIAVHMVDLMRFTSGREMLEAVSFQGRIGHPELGDMENTTATIFRLDNGGTAALHMDYLRPETAPTHGDDRLRLAGTEGVVEFQESTGVTLITGREKPRVLSDLPPGGSLFLDFLDSVYNGKPAGLSIGDIWKVNEIVLAARESAERHSIVKVL